MDYFQSKVSVHFIGIGGIGMSGIAEILLSQGFNVTGSDAKSSENTLKLESLGAKIFIGHNKDNIKGSSVVVYTSAIKEDNPEFEHAKKNHIPLMRRAEMLAEIMRIKKGVAIGGTHGKTTTTSMLATILHESNFDPTYIIGGVVTNLKGHAKVGKGDYIIAEADESDGSFLLLNPILNVITNIDDDHLDHYGASEKVDEAFEKFANNIPFYGVTSLNFENKRIRTLAKKLKKNFVSFSILYEGHNYETTFQAEIIGQSMEGISFKLFHLGEYKVEIKLNLPGVHNVLNSLGAISMAYSMGVSFSLIAHSLTQFKGVGRRLEHLYINNDFEIIDDYGHHPTAIIEIIKTMKKSRLDKKIIVVFEPHRYTRTRDSWNDFLHCFNDADEVFLAPIYPASETEIIGINSKRLSEDLNQLHPNFSRYLMSMDYIEEVIKDNINSKTVLLTMGAGAIGKSIRKIVENIKNEYKS